MTVWAEIAAVEANPVLTPDAKRKEVFRLKAHAIRDTYAGGTYLNKTVRYQGIDFTVHYVFVSVVNGITETRFALTAMRVSDGVILIDMSREFVLVNPPVHGPNGEMDLVLAAREILTHVLPR